MLLIYVSIKFNTMENSSDEENINTRSSCYIEGNYKSFPFSESRLNSLSYLFSQSSDTEFIKDIKQPSLSSVNMTDSLCSNSTLSLNFNNDKQMEDTQEINDIGKCSNGDVNYSEPTDLQNMSFVNENLCSQSNIAVKQFFETGYKEDFNTHKMSDLISYDKFYSRTPMESLNRVKKFASMSLQDVTIIDLFPLESKTTNAFSTETIQTQSMSSTTKSKDSGFQRSASCLSLNSGNRSYEHIQSKVKQYIKDIKDSEAKRKKDKLNVSNDTSGNRNVSDSKNVIVNVLTTSTDEQTIMNECIAQLKDELKEKNTILNELQQNYNTLLGKYAEAVNQIDVLRVRSSLNYDYHSDRNNDVYASRNCSSLFSDQLRQTSKSNTNLSTYDNTTWYNAALQNIPSVLELNLNQTVNNNNEGLQVAENVNRVTETSNIENVNEEFNNVTINDSLNDCNDGLSNVDTISNELEQFSMIDLQQPQSTSQSASLNTVSSLKSSALRPISRMYSSSSRLDKKISPLPSSSSSALATKTKESSGKLNTRKKQCNNNNDSNNVAKNTSEIINNDMSNSVSNNTNNTIVQDINKKKSKVHYRRFSDTFKKISPKWEWHYSLPTKELTRSHSSSSIYNSVDDSNLDEDNLNSNGFTQLYKENVKQANEKVGSQVVLDSHNNYDLISKSDHNLKMSNNSNFNGTYMKKPASIVPKNVFKRSDAFDRNSGELNGNLYDVYGSRMSGGRIDIQHKGDDNSLIDDSTSLSSSILSSEDDNSLNKMLQGMHNLGRNALPNRKNNNVSEMLNNNSSAISTKSSNIVNETNNSSVVSKTKSRDEKDNSKKRIRGLILGIHSDDKPHTIKKAWESPKRDDSKLKKKDNSQKKCDIFNNSCNVNNKNKNKRDSVTFTRKEILKSYTEMLSTNSCLDAKVKTTNVDVGTQMSDDEAVTKLSTSCSGSLSTSMYQNLKEAEDYVKYVMKEMERIRSDIKKLHNSYKGSVFDGDSS